MRSCQHLHRRVTKHYLACAEKGCGKMIRKLSGHEQYTLVQIGLKEVGDAPKEMKTYVESGLDSDFSRLMRSRASC